MKYENIISTVPKRPIEYQALRLNAKLGYLMLALFKWWPYDYFRTFISSPSAAGHTIVFGNETGIDLWGNISLGKDDIATNWLSVSWSLFTQACTRSSYHYLGQDRVLHYIVKKL